MLLLSVLLLRVLLLRVLLLRVLLLSVLLLMVPLTGAAECAAAAECATNWRCLAATNWRCLGQARQIQELFRSTVSTTTVCAPLDLSAQLICCLTICLSVSLSLCLTVCLSVSLPIRLPSHCLSVCLFHCLSLASLTHSLSLVLVVMMKSKELKTKIYSHADSQILSLLLSASLHSQNPTPTLPHTPYHLYLLL